MAPSRQTAGAELRDHHKTESLAQLLYDILKNYLKPVFFIGTKKLFDLPNYGVLSIAGIAKSLFSLPAQPPITPVLNMTLHTTEVTKF